MNNFYQIRDWLAQKLKKKNKTDFLIMILLGVLVMIIALPTGSGGKEKAATEKEKESGTKGQEEKDVLSEETYRASLEQQLEKLIEKMQGAGDSRVMITLADEGYTYVDKNTLTDDKKKEETTVVYDTGEGDSPYVVRRERPKVEGVVVVCEGGDSPGVVTEISDAVMSLFGLEPHKVIVVKMSVQEEQQ